MNGNCFQDPIGFIKFSISPEFVPLLMDKDLLHKIFVSLLGIKQELYAKRGPARGGSHVARLNFKTSRVCVLMLHVAVGN